MDTTKREIPKFKGEILLCEDNEINQHVIRGHLTRSGLEVTVAGDGQQGIDAVKRRAEGGTAPFDLIFMDIQMPVMGGLEAADAITRLGLNVPLVALTSNVTAEDTQLYARHGMPRSLRKPFSAEELWVCLGEYLTRTGSETVLEEDRRQEEEKKRKKLFSSFVRRNQTTYEDICRALDEGDVKLAHRLAHTLRGLAGLMEKGALMEAARVVEHALAGGDRNALSPEALETVGRELKTVLTELAPYLEEPKPDASAAPWDRAEVEALLARLEPLLRGDNAASQQFADPLRRVPQSGALVTKLEEYEFEEALEELVRLKTALGLSQSAE